MREGRWGGGRPPSPATHPAFPRPASSSLALALALGLGLTPRWQVGDPPAAERAPGWGQAPPVSSTAGEAVPPLEDEPPPLE